MNNLDIVQTKESNLKEIVSQLESVMIAYSGGVDSSLLSYYGRHLLGGKATIVIAISPSLALGELAFARLQSSQFNWDLVEIETSEVEKQEYQRNDQMRCYFCKSTLFEAMHKLASEKGVRHLAYGANLDDRSDFRPGALAASEFHVLSPLQDAGLTKEEIRHLAKVAGLPSWDRPQAACLSSRFPTFQPITVGQLSQVDQAETVLRHYGFRQVRVRHHNQIASIEVDQSEIARLLDEALYNTISEQLKQLGYLNVTVDPQGYRQGSANAHVD
jgi:pyridinium-3,5-biscarboxylic acid mononucleotide sulfurtransferase